MKKTKRPIIKYDPISMESEPSWRLSYLEKSTHSRILLKSIVIAGLIALIILTLLYFNVYYFFYEINN